jgi:hypothetical protein
VGWYAWNVFIFYVKVPKTAESSDLLRKGHTFLGQALYKGHKICSSSNSGVYGYQKTQNLLQILKNETYLSDKMHLKKLFEIKDFRIYTGGHLSAGENL